MALNTLLHSGRYRELQGSWANIEITAQPVNRPVTTAVAKSFTRVPDASEDDLIDMYIDAAVEWCKRHGVYLISTEIRQEYTVTFGCGQYDWAKIRGNPVQDIVKAELRQINSEDYTLIESEKYAHRKLDGDSYLLFNDDVVETTSDVREDIDRLRVTTKMGFGDDPEDVPADIRIGLLNYVSAMYEYRDDAIKAPVMLQNAIAKYRSFYGT